MSKFRYSSQDLTLSRTLDIQPRPERFSMHTHAFAEVYCFLSGKGVFHIEGSEYPLEPWDILLMRPTEAHYIEMDPSVPYERIVINLDTNLFSALDPEGTLTRAFFDRKSGTMNLYRSSDFPDHQWRQCLLNMVSGEEPHRAVILANLILLLQQISLVFGTPAQSIAHQTTTEQRMIEYINQHLDRELTLQGLCDRFYISRAQLCRRFKKATGTSVGKYISVKRLLACRQLILKGQKPTVVCAAFGYKDYSTFYRAYMTQFGHSPRQEPLPLPYRDNFIPGNENDI